MAFDKSLFCTARMRIFIFLGVLFLGINLLAGINSHVDGLSSSISGAFASSVSISKQTFSLPIIVLSMHASGSSEFAWQLAKRGFSRLVPDLTPHHEHYRVDQLNERILRAAGMSWRSPGPVPAHIMLNETGWCKTIEEIITSFKDQPVWVLKDPRFAFTLPVWERCRPHLFDHRILVFRNPVDVSSSLYSRDKKYKKKEEYLDLWYATNLAALRLRPQLVFDSETSTGRFDEIVDIIKARFKIPMPSRPPVASSGFIQNGRTPRKYPIGNLTISSAVSSLYADLVSLASATTPASGQIQHTASFPPDNLTRTFNHSWYFLPPNYPGERLSRTNQLLPELIVLGAQKAGTSFLRTVLRGIGFNGGPAEVHFFDRAQSTDLGTLVEGYHKALKRSVRKKNRGSGTNTNSIQQMLGDLRLKKRYHYQLSRRNITIQRLKTMSAKSFQRLIPSATDRYRIAAYLNILPTMRMPQVEIDEAAAAEEPAAEEPSHGCLDVTPSYLCNPEAPVLIRRVYPHARFVVLLREPAERYLSSLRMELCRSNLQLGTNGTFRQQKAAIAGIGTFHAPGKVPQYLSQARKEFLRGKRKRKTNWCAGPAILRGAYEEQLRYWYEFFEPEQFRIIHSSEMQRTPVQAISKLLRWLSVPSPPNLEAIVANAKGTYAEKSSYRDHKDCIVNAKQQNLKDTDMRDLFAFAASLNPNIPF